MPGELDQNVDQSQDGGEKVSVDKNKKVAVCIPYYRKTDTLKRLLLSVKSQTFDDYIVIVTDDSSDPEAEELVGSFDDRFLYYRNEVQLGPTKNCNQAIRLSQSYHPQYVKVMHHDDYFNCEDSLEQYVKMLDDNPEAIFAFSGSKSDINMGQETYERFAQEEQISRLRENKYSVLEGNFIGDPSVTIIRNTGILMDENLIWLVDVDWYLKLMEYKHCFAYTERPLAGVGIDGSSVTDYCLKKRDLIQKEYLYVYLKHSGMQDFSCLDYIIRQCIIFYRKEGGYWHRDDYLAILRDALIDGKKIWLWGTGQDGDGERYELLRRKGITADCHADWNAVETKKEDYFCIVMADEAKAIRKMLAQKGMNSLPFIEKFIREL